MIGYIQLRLAIFLELIGTNFMKASDGFINFPYTAGTLLAYSTCFYFLSLSLKTIKLSVAYATWGGLGIVLSALVSFFIWKEKISLTGLAGIALIVTGVILCNVFRAKH